MKKTHCFRRRRRSAFGFVGSLMVMFGEAGVLGVLVSVSTVWLVSPAQQPLVERRSVVTTAPCSRGMSSEVDWSRLVDEARVQCENFLIH